MAGYNKKFVPNDVTAQLASSVLYYDEEELASIIEIWDSLGADKQFVPDPMFDTFLSYIKKSDIHEKDPEKRKALNILNIEELNKLETARANQDKFALWFDKVKSLNLPLQLSDDILDCFIWGTYKDKIQMLDDSDLPFREKLNARPISPSLLSDSGIIRIDQIEHTDIDAEPYTTGLPDIDVAIKPVPSNLLIFAARPGVGKSLVMLKMALDNAKEGKKVLFVSLEMTDGQLEQRIMNYYKGYAVKLKDFPKVREEEGFKSILENFRIFVSPYATAEPMFDKIEESLETEKFEIVFVDYLQRLKYARCDDWTSIRYATWNLKDMAFKKEILVVTGTQVSRSSTNTSLSLTDMFGSASIEFDADIIIGIESFVETRYNNKDATVNFKCLKNRQGPLYEDKFIIDYSTGRVNKS